MNAETMYHAWVTIYQAHIALERGVDARLRPWNLNFAQNGALRVLSDHGPQRMSYLARFLLQQTQTTTDLVDRLERRGLVRRVRHETDRRVVLVAITDAGRALMDEIGDAAWSVGREAFQSVSADHLEALVENLRRIRDIAAAAAGLQSEHLAYAEHRLSVPPPKEWAIAAD